MLACAAAGCPFFPTAYHTCPASLSLGLQGVDVVLEALQVHIQDELMPVDLLRASEWVRAALVERAAPVVALGQAVLLRQCLPESDYRDRKSTRLNSSHT